MFTIEKYENKILEFYEFLKKVPQIYTDKKLQDDKWSLKEIIGHLIDSASNNHQRFVRLQENDDLTFPIYNQEIWIQIQKYNDYNWVELIEFWRLYNLLLLHIIKNVNEKTLNNVWTNENEKIILSTLISDYFNHLEWHIGQFKGRLAEFEIWIK